VSGEVKKRVKVYDVNIHLYGISRYGDPDCEHDFSREDRRFDTITYGGTRVDCIWRCLECGSELNHFIGNIRMPNKVPPDVEFWEEESEMRHPEE